MKCVYVLLKRDFQTVQRTPTEMNVSVSLSNCIDLRVQYSFHDSVDITVALAPSLAMGL